MWITEISIFAFNSSLFKPWFLSSRYLSVCFEKNERLLTTLKLMAMLISSSWCNWNPGECSTEVYMGASAKRATPQYIPLLTEKAPVSYALTMYSFYIASLEPCTLFDCLKCTVVQIWINQVVFLSFPSQKMYLLASLGPVTNCNDTFSYPFIYFNYWNPYPFIHQKPD